MKTDHYVVICDLIHLQHFTSKYFLFANLHLPISQELTRSFFEFEMTLQYMLVSIKFGTNTIYRHTLCIGNMKTNVEKSSSEFPTLIGVRKYQSSTN